MHKTVINSFKKTIIIEKSKFIAILMPATNKNELVHIKKKFHKDFADANHICYAYHIQGEQGFNDDGEPKGLAGKPILEIINYYHLTDIIIWVIRYFGGKKLGAGGLMRAYSQSARNIINISELKTISNGLLCQIKVNHHDYQKINYILQKKSNIQNTTFTNIVVIDFLILKEDLTTIQKLCLPFKIVIIQEKNFIH